MKKPFRGSGLLRKQPALSLTKLSEPSLWTRPQTTRSPKVMMDPVRMKTPASAAAGPTVGANCRGGVTADAIGWLKLGADGRWRYPGRDSALKSAHGRHKKNTRCTQVQDPREEVKPLLLPV